MSSPISHWSSSPGSQKSPSNSNNVLTPSRKVKALLAQFDDSDSEHSAGRNTPKNTSILSTTSEITSKDQKQLRDATTADSSEEDDLRPLAPHGRLAARLQAAATANEAVTRDNETGGSVDKTIEKLLEASVQEQEENSPPDDKSTASSEDELARPALRRRLLLKRKSSPIEANEPATRRARSASPLFFPSPSASRRLPSASASTSRGSPSPPPNSAAAGHSKFLALVEKHRKQRLEREAAETARKAAMTEQLQRKSGRARGQRGSSPADDSNEDSDASEDGSVKKLTKEARPTRKASKKALEEMNRETQRMNRNMQLAHQARTRKKITKESLLARFNFSLPVFEGFAETKGKSTPTTASSATASDSEAAREHVTPATSPLQEDFSEKQVDEQHQGLPPRLETVMVTEVEELPTLEKTMAKSVVNLDTDKGKAIASDAKPARKDARPIRVRWTKQDAVMARGGDSDSDLEIITSNANTRKYAVFETLPRRKAKETESHIALRSLAHLMGGDEKKRSSMNAVEMERALRKAAREQARRERQEKIEELKSKGVIIQTAEERERDQQDVEDIVERARQEAAEIQKREKELAKKDGTFVKDGLDDSDDEEDGDFEDENENARDEASGIEEEEEGEDEDEDEDEEEEEEEENENAEQGIEVEGVDILENDQGYLIDDHANEQGSDEDTEEEMFSDEAEADAAAEVGESQVARRSRNTRVVSDDDEDDEGQDNAADITSPALPTTVKTPLSITRSARKLIPGLPMSDDLPLGLTQAFAATMADTQTQDDMTGTQEQDSLKMTRNLPSPNIPFAPRLNRLESLDIISDSQPASQTQPLNINLSFSQSQTVPQSPVVGLGIAGTQFTPSQMPFEPTQDAGYMMSPFAGNRFAQETPTHPAPHSTADTVILPNGGDESPVLQRKGRLRRGRVLGSDDEDLEHQETNKSAFEVMRKAAKQNATGPDFDKTKSAAKEIIDEAAEESEDEYAGLGGASDDEAGEEDEHDREMIDHDTQVGRGDEAKLAGLFADRERKQDEAAVSKLLKDITTGALRRKRGVGDDLDLSDEEDAAARRREAKRREFAKMRRELLKDEAVGKIAEDRKKEAFLRSIEDREAAQDGDDDDDFDQPETPLDESQSQSQLLEGAESQGTASGQDPQDQESVDQKRKHPLKETSSSTLNHLPPSLPGSRTNKRPSTLAEIRESVSFLIDEPDSQTAMIDLGLSDSEDEPEAYVDLDRHFAAADENAEDDDLQDLGDFIVDDDGLANDPKDNAMFKKPTIPAKRAPFNERRTKTRTNVVDRLQLLRQASSSSASSHGSRSSTKLAFFTNTSGTDSSFGKVPSLLRRATTNSSFGSMAGRNEEVSATGVTTSKTERGGIEHEKEFVRKAAGGRKNAVNYRAKPVEEKMAARAGVKKKATKGKGGKDESGFLGGLFRGNSWD